MSSLKNMDAQTEIELQAAAFRALQSHLQNRTDVQIIDMMNLTGFCRNCLSRWIEVEAARNGMDVSKADAREYVYGMPFEEWKAKYQTDATPQQQAEFAKTHPTEEK